MRTSISLYRRHRFPAEIISHCVWLYRLEPEPFDIRPSRVSFMRLVKAKIKMGLIWWRDVLIRN